MAEAKRKTIKKKVAAAEKRNAARSERTFLDRAGEDAIEAKDKFTAFAKEHPVATLAGGLAIGVLIAGMFKGPRQAAMKGGTKAAGLAAIGAELAMAYAAKALDAAKEAGSEGADWLGETGKTLGSKAREFSSEASDYAGTARDSAMRSGRSAAKAIRGRLN